MRIVVALGSNALLRRGETMNAANQRHNIRIACEQIARIYPGNELVIAHGNSPHIGLLAMQDAACADMPLDVLGAESVGMIGYMIQQELGNLVPFEVPLATLLSQVEVDRDDPAFAAPDKPIGAFYSRDEAEKLAREKGWTMAQDGEHYRRVVPSPAPKRIFEIRPVQWLLEKGSIVICAGGGGIPTYYDAQHNLRGVDAVIDKDLCAALLAENIHADIFVIATDVSAVFTDWGTPEQKAIALAHPDALERLDFAAASMAPKVRAAISFVRRSGRDAVIGPLSDLGELVTGKAGTRISTRTQDISFY
ncbi:MAG: carbamate kinase [Cardiobacteriaceae bacterium]|nr:carbamate kinase [Cardiobacteriaceae bacterium]